MSLGEFIKKPVYKTVQGHNVSENAPTRLILCLLVCTVASGAGIALIAERTSSLTLLLIVGAIAGLVFAMVMSSTSFWRLALICIAGGQVFVLAMQYLLWTVGVPQLPDQIFSLWEISWGAIIFVTVIRRFGERERMQLYAFDWCIFAYLFFALTLGVVSSGNITLILYSIRLTYFPTLIYVGVRLLPITPADARRVFVTFLSSASLLAVVGLWMYFVWSPDQKIAYLARSVGGLGDLAPDTFYYTMREGVSTMFSLLNNPMYLGPIIAIAALICSAAVPFQSKRKRRLVWGIGVVLFTVCNFLIFSRGSWSIQALGTVVLLLYHPKRRVLLNYVLVEALFVMCVFIFVFIRSNGLGTGDNFAGLALRISQYMSLESLSLGRATQWQPAVDAWAGRLIGYGLGQVGHVGARFPDLVNRGAPFIADSWFLKVSLEVGVQGLLAFVGFYLLLVAKAIKTARAVKCDSFVAVMIIAIPAIMVGLVADSIGHDTYDLYITNMFFWVLCALVPVLGKELQAMSGSCAMPLHQSPSTSDISSTDMNNSRLVKGKIGKTRTPSLRTL
jgi:O-Antigen ligase